MPATNPVESRHRIALNLPTEGQHLTSVCTELHVMHIYPTLNLPGLMRTLEVTSQNTSVLHNLNGLQRASRLIDIVGVDRLVARNAVRRPLLRRPLGYRRAAQNTQRNHQKQKRLRVKSTHAIPPAIKSQFLPSGYTAIGSHHSSRLE
jgi:hypothetical protein